MVTAIKPLVPYHGGKSRLTEWIVGLMPRHRVYLEPFAGSAAVLLAKPRSTHEILNDVDGNVVNFYQVLREDPDELERLCRLTPYSREEFLLADLHDEDLTPLERARRWWVRVNQSFAHTGTDATGWSTSIMRGSNNARTVSNRIGRFAAVAERLATVTIECTDAIALIAAHSVPDAVIYADPPYLISTRSAMLRRPNGDYAHEFASDADHRALAEVPPQLRRHGAALRISLAPVRRALRRMAPSRTPRRTPDQQRPIRGTAPRHRSHLVQPRDPGRSVVNGRGDLEHAADELAGLLENTTPAPWRLSTPGTDGARYRALVADNCIRDCDADYVARLAGGPEWMRHHPHDGYGGCLVAESISTPDREILAAMRNAAEHLPDLLRAVAHEDPIAVSQHARRIAADLCPCDAHDHRPKDTT